MFDKKKEVEEICRICQIDRPIHFRVLFFYIYKRESVIQFCPGFAIKLVQIISISVSEFFKNHRDNYEEKNICVSK